MSAIIFSALFVIVPILSLGIFVLVFALIFSPKLRGKFMSKQIKAANYMLKDVQDDLTEMGTITGQIDAYTRKSILDQNEDVLKDVEIREANIEKEGIEIKTRAIKDGFKGDTMYCKHCGALIDEDSKFCKKCGKEQ